MPIYRYKILKPEGQISEIVEIEQGINDPSLSHHPQTGEALERIWDVPKLNSQYTRRATQKILEPQKIEQAGFTQYERDALTGRYHKTVGKDPRSPDTVEP